MNDGPQGFRTSDGSSGTSTAWPSALTLAATFDTQLAGEWGHAMGQEFRDKGAGMQVRDLPTRPLPAPHPQTSHFNPLRMRSAAPRFERDNLQLGPGVNVARLPECGRNFE
jgi:beta-glucosidase